MTVNEKVHEILRSADVFQETAAKVRDGINKVIEPQVKEARLAAHDSQRMLAILARRITVLFTVSIAANVATVIAVLSLTR